MGGFLSPLPDPSPSSHRLGAVVGLWWVDGRHGDEGDPEVADPGEDAVQLGLVGDGAGERRGAVAVVGELEPTEPGRPVGVEVPADAQHVGGRPAAEGAVHDAPTSSVGRRVRSAARRRMTASAATRLSAQAAPRPRSWASTLVPKAAPAMPKVIVWVPAPSAKA